MNVFLEDKKFAIPSGFVKDLTVLSNFSAEYGLRKWRN
jgi:hypothetical protein